ncbi:MAG: pyruvate, phosphate dikinase [Planctomycetota bacterium]|jgi:pyruvate,orthophosphate dikinase|nr:pyruvate, phosphate dikinase [Planctomycetota bacterium]
MAKTKMIYFFGDGAAEGTAAMKKELGGKGANLADMSSIGLPVPPGFTITTAVCAAYYDEGKALPAGLDQELAAHLARLEKSTGKTFGAGDNPLLVSVRSGAAVSMPGMMDTVLNLGLNDQTLKALVALTGNERFALDSYRRFLQMFGDVVLGIAHHDFEQALEKIKKEFGKKNGVKGIENLEQEQLSKAVPDTALGIDELKKVIAGYMDVYKKNGKKFPQDARQQLRAAIEAVFGSWNNARANKYREINDIRGLLGTAVNVQSMVFGNSGENSATGVAFTRDPSTGENRYFYGEYLINAQGEDVVAGIRTPQQITKLGSQEWAKNNGVAEKVRAETYPSLEEALPKCFKELDAIRRKLEKHYKDMQDLEFTIEHGKLYMLQTRNGKRTGAAAVRIAVDLVKEKIIDEKTALKRIEPGHLDQLLHPVFDPAAEKKAKIIAKGLAASPGAACGQIVFNAEDAAKWHKEKKTVILCRVETSPEDIGGMTVAGGILTVRGGQTSHAAVVARGMGKCCVSGCGEIVMNYAKKTLSVGGKTYKEGDFLSLNGSTGAVYEGKIETQAASLGGAFAEVMNWSDKFRKIGVRANGDTPTDAETAFRFGAEGIGLCRTEHMFFEGKKIVSFRRFILVAEEVKNLKAEFAVGDLNELKKVVKDANAKKALAQYEQALKELLKLQKQDFVEIFKAMKGRPVVVRLLDPPLHEFVPHDDAGQKEMAKAMGVELAAVRKIVAELNEFNPMLGHRGCRLGITYPEITAMQTRAIVEAGIEVKGSQPEIMVPLVGKLEEFVNQKKVIEATIAAIKAERGLKQLPSHIEIGTMIEVPRAALTADAIAKEAEFFSFGTNDLTQMTCGFSRDDAGKFLKDYVAAGIYEYDPFKSLDQEGVGKLLKYAVKLGREGRKNIKIGICGEHGGDPRTIAFCREAGLNYVSCSPYRVPIARLAAAQAEIK